MKKIKVIQLIDSLDIGGAEVLAVNSCNLLNETAHVHSYLAVTRKEGALLEKTDRKNYVFLGRKTTIDLSAVLRLRKFIKKNKIQIIHAHASSYFFAFCVKIFLPSIKIVWHDHYGKSNFLAQRKKQPLQFISRFMSAVLVVNTELLHWNKKYLKVKLVQLVNNFAYFNDTTEKTKLKGKAGKRIVMTAAFRPQKDHLNLLRAFYRVQKEYPEWTLHLIGANPMDNYGKSITDYIQTKKMNSSVFMYGACNDIKTILAQSDIAVLSSNSEGLPLALLEYGLAKVPVVVTEVGECNKVVENGKSGVLVAPENKTQLADAIISLIQEPEKRKSYAKKLNVTIEENYSKKKYIDQLCEIYIKKLW